MKRYFVPALMVLLVVSCTERIDIALDEQAYARLVVEGGISSDTMAQVVRLTKTSDYFENQPPEPVTGATVTISNDLEEYNLTENPAGSGIYLTAGDVYGTPGRLYELKIILAEEIGGAREYTGSSEMFPIYPLDSIRLEFMPDWGEAGFWEVECYVLDPPTTDYYMFQVFRNRILINDTIDEVFVVDDVLYNGNYTNGIGVGYLDQSRGDEKLLPGDTVTLKISRITQEYTDFIWQLQEEVSYQTPLFSGPPANVNGNISGGAFGFFAAYSATYASVIVADDQ